MICKSLVERLRRLLILDAFAAAKSTTSEASGVLRLNRLRVDSQLVGKRKAQSGSLLQFLTSRRFDRDTVASVT